MVGSYTQSIFFGVGVEVVGGGEGGEKKEGTCTTGVYRFETLCIVLSYGYVPVSPSVPEMECMPLGGHPFLRRCLWGS